MKSTVLRVRIPDDVYKDLSSEAWRSGVSVSDVVRRALDARHDKADLQRLTTLLADLRIELRQRDLLVARLAMTGAIAAEEAAAKVGVDVEVMAATRDETYSEMLEILGGNHGA